MDERIKKTEKEFMKYVEKMTAYNEALSLIYWDMRTGAPKEGLTIRSDVIGTLSAEIFRMSTSEEMALFLAQITKKDVNIHLSELTRNTAEYCRREYERNRRIPSHLYKEYAILQSKAETVWEEAKEAGDFEKLQPWLEKLVEMNKRFINYWGWQGNKYNPLLDIYEPGITVEELDEVFTELRRKIIPLVQAIAKAKKKPETNFLTAFFPKKQQEAFNKEILRQMGFNFAAGRIDTSVHPFSTGINPSDVRITTKFDEYDFRTALFSTMHEGGHALYEQNISKELVGTPLCTGASMGIHESQSLFYENFIGRNYSFWKKYYPLLNEYSGGLFTNIPLDDFYWAINEAKPSLIRIEADELTYPLHIIIRYEIEKALFNDEVKVSELVQVWNEEYLQYLGVKPEHDGEGVLQDVHWAGGNFGYFPSYALGFIYGAQIKHALLEELPEFEELLAEGDLLPIKKWLNEKIHQFGRMKKPLEILKDVTGEELNPTYLTEYLSEKYSRLYGL